MFPSPFYFFFALFSLIIVTLAEECRNHPAYSRSLKPVLVSRWQFTNIHPTAEQSVYIRRYTGHTYAPISDSKSSIFAGLDLFYPLSGPHKSITMKFQRPATVYVFASVPKSKFNTKKRLRLSGWKSLGWAALIRGGNNITYGIHQQVTQNMPRYVYVFKQRGKTKFVLPDTNVTRKVAGGIGYIVLIGESDGKPSPFVGTFKGKNIQSNSRCPDSLHDVWVTRDPNKRDKDTRGKLFRTWHPAWDPCFWCAYDHDHGANPAGVFNYKPMFGYTAFKNNRQDESHPGFKGFIFSVHKYWVYLNLHIQASKIRRVFTRAHTMNIVIAEKKTKTVVMDIRFKADFGFAAVQTKRRELQAISPANNRIRKSEKRLLFRTINVLNPTKPNKKFLLRRNNVRLGAYEEWRTTAICSDPAPFTGVKFTFKAPGTGILSLKNSGTPVRLGRTFRGRLYRSLNLYRTVKFRRLTLGAQFCPSGKSGEFYTDPTGTTVVKGPARNAVRQYVKPEFSLHLIGKYEVADPWKGIYTLGTKGFFRDHGYGLNPSVV